MNEKSNPEEIKQEHLSKCYENLMGIGRQISAIGYLIENDGGAGAMPEWERYGFGELIGELGDRVRHTVRQIQRADKVAAGGLEPALYHHEMWETEEK